MQPPRPHATDQPAPVHAARATPPRATGEPAHPRAGPAPSRRALGLAAGIAPPLATRPDPPGADGLAPTGAAGFDAALLDALPALRRYASALARHRQDAEDLVQDCVIRMLGASDRFRPGSSFRAWAFTILRNRFISECVRRRRRFVSLDAAEVPVASTDAVQSQRLELLDLRRQFATLSAPAQRVLRLAAEADNPYLAIAERDGCVVGTVKSRVHRARAQLRARLAAAYH